MGIIEKILIVICLVLMVLLGMAGWYYHTSQGTIAMLNQQNAAQALALKTQQLTITTMQEKTEQQASAMTVLEQRSLVAYQYRSDLEKKFATPAFKKEAVTNAPALQKSMNDAAKKVFTNLEAITSVYTNTYVGSDAKGKQ